MGRKYFFVGVDPGTTTACALVDLKGGVLSFESRKGWGLNGVVEYIAQMGRPSQIACDVSQAPSFAQKVAASFGVPLYCPEKDLDVTWKNELTCDIDCSDKHQRDACAAAYAAYNHYQNKLKNLAARGLSDKIKHLVLQGISLSEAKKLTETKKTAEPKGKVYPKKSVVSKKEEGGVGVRRLKVQNKNLRKELESKKKKISKLRKQARFINSKMNESILLDKAVASRDKTIESLKRKLRRRRRELDQALGLEAILLDLADGKIVLVPTYPKKYLGVTRISNKLPKDFSDAGVEFVFTGRKKTGDLLAEYGIPTEREGVLADIYGVKYISADKLKKIKEKRRVSLERMLSDYRSRRSKT